MAAASSPSIPLHAPARASVARRARFAGRIPVARLPRLAAALAGADAALEIDLQAGPDDAGAPQLRGSIRGALPLLCQRCLRPFEMLLDTAVNLRLVQSEAEESRLLHECEPCLVEDDRLMLHQIVEDEVLLGLPLAPHCGRSDCAAAEAGPGQQSAGG